MHVTNVMLSRMMVSEIAAVFCHSVHFCTCVLGFGKARERGTTTNSPSLNAEYHS